MNKLIRITTVPVSLKSLLRGQLAYMSDYFNVLGVASSGMQLEQVRVEGRVEVVPIEMTRSITPLKDIVALYNMYRLLRKEKPLIVHSHTPKAGTVGMMAAWLARVPLRLHTIAGLPLLETTGNKRLLLDFVEKVTYACATNVYPNSVGLYNIIIKNKYTSKKKLKVIANGSSNGIDTSFFNPELYSDEQKHQLKSELGIKEQAFVFIFVGRLVKDKGLNELVKVFESLRFEGLAKADLRLRFESLDVKMVLVGDYERELDPLKPETEKEINENPDIIAVGFREDVRPYFAIADALVFPSYREGFPNVVMQAGAMGLPSIVTDINGCNEIIRDGVNGIIIPPKNEGELKTAMLRIMDNKEERLQMASVARQMIAERYEQKMVWEALLAEYKRLEENVRMGRCRD